MSRRPHSIVCHDIHTKSGAHRVRQHVDLDEVVVPGCVHIEDMGGGTWCVILGKGDMTLYVGQRGVTIVERSARVRGERAVVGFSDGSVAALEVVRDQPECVRDVTLYYPEPKPR